MSSIHLESVAKLWGEARALDAISFDTEPGSFVVLLGPLIVTAATLMSSAPLLIAFLLFQRQFVQSFMRVGIR